MATPWDDSLKLLIGANAQDFVSWIMKGAEVKARLATEFKGKELRADALIHVQVVGKRRKRKDILLQIEVQSERDPEMRERLLEYNLRARREHKMPVYSCVIYLRDDGIVLPSPLHWELPNGKTFLDFRFDSVELHKMTAAQLRQLGLPGLLPLMILTKDGATREIADEIFTNLELAERWDSLSPTYILVSLALGKNNDEDQQWLLRRLADMHEMLRENPVYQEMTRLAREEGLEAGLQQGLQQGQLQTLRQMATEIVIERFPELLRLAEEKVIATNEPILLRRAVLKLSTAATAEEARQALLKLSEVH